MNIVIIRSDQETDQCVGRGMLEKKVVSSTLKTLLSGKRRSATMYREAYFSAVAARDAELCIASAG